MAHVTPNASLPLDFGGIIKMRLNLKRAMMLLDDILADAPSAGFAYNHTASGLSAVTVQAAIDELAASVAETNAELEGGLAPLLVSSALTTIVLTAAANFTDTNGDILPIATLYTTSASAVAASMTKTESDKVPIGTILLLAQSAGAVTITGSGGVTFTARGTPTGGLTARAVKVTAALWLVDYGTPHA